MLSAEQAAIVKGCLARGDKQHDIAAYFGENGGRVAEIAKGHKHPDVKPAPKRLLPTPQQMMPAGFIVQEVRAAIQVIEIGLASAKARLNEMEAKLNDRRN